MGDKSNHIIDILDILVKWRKVIISIFFVVCFITAAITLIMPKTYTAKTVMLPPTSDSQGLGLSQFLNNLPISGLGFGAMSEETYTVMAILNSRSTMYAIINDFDLIKRYKADNIELAEKKLRKRIKFEINEEGTISIFASAKTKFFSGKEEENGTQRFASDLANAFVHKLDKTNRQVRTERAKNTRLYIEKRYLQNLDDLKNAEEAFKLFQQEEDVIALPEQTAAVIEAAAEVNAMIYAKEVELGVLEKNVGHSNSEYKKVKGEISELQNKLQEMRFGSKTEDKGVFIPLNDVPDLGVEYVRLFREVKLQEKLMEFLLPQYEQARIEEMKDTPTIQILDDAVPPILRSSPKRGLTVVAMGLVALMFGIAYAYFREYLNRIQEADPNRYGKIENMMFEIRNDFSKLVKVKGRT